MTHTAYLAFGSNMGNSRSLIQSALLALKDNGIQVKQLSRLYLTKASNLSEKQANNFLNAVCRIECSLSPQAILLLCQKIEENLGRHRWINSVSSRTIDIDLLFYDNIICKTNLLTLPHPEALNRDFVLFPLGEVLLPGWKDPVTGLSYEHVLNDFQHKNPSTSQCRSIITTLF